jgi:DNA mismatch repair protein MSH6
MDADIGFSELDLIYMRGTKAHSGFPEISYGKFASILVQKGYRVARVEQTETPDMLKERNDSLGKGIKKEKVVARELCSIMTKGTRTYCHLDDLSFLDENDGGNAISTSLLICIKESSLSSKESKMTEEDEQEEEDGVVEYGITAVDTVVGKIILAQFHDNLQRSRLRGLLARFPATEILLEKNGYSDETYGVIKLLCPKAVIENLMSSNGEMPSKPSETILSLYKAQYFPLESKNTESTSSPEEKGEKKRLSASSLSIEEIINTVSSFWPEILVAVMKGTLTGASDLMMIALGGALWQLKRSLIDYEVISLGNFIPYIPTDEETSVISQNTSQSLTTTSDKKTVFLPSSISTFDESIGTAADDVNNEVISENKMEMSSTFTTTSSQKHMILDEVALSNLEVLINNYDRTEVGSLWSFVNRCRTIGGKRLLRNWLCQPLYHVKDIQRRSTAVEELLSLHKEGLLDEVKRKLKLVPDLERLLLRVHSNGVKKKANFNDHPDTRAVFFEASTYTIRKIKDFADVLSGFEIILSIIDIFIKFPLKSSLLKYTLHPASTASSTSASNPAFSFPYSELKETLSYFRTIFDEKQAKKDGNIKPKPGINSDYDEAMESIHDIIVELENYLKEMKKQTGISDMTYFGNGKDRYQIEIPMSLTKNIPASWISKSQKKTHRRYRTKFLEEKFTELMLYEEKAIIAQKDTLRSIFEKFDDYRNQWDKAANSISFLDALLSLTMISSLPSYCLPEFLEKSFVKGSVLDIKGGRHPMLEFTLSQK